LISTCPKTRNPEHSNGAISQAKDLGNGDCGDAVLECFPENLFTCLKMGRYSVLVGRLDVIASGFCIASYNSKS